MKVFIERDGEEKTLSFSGKAAELLEQLEINVETVVITRNGELITEQDKLEDNDDVNIISVVSGG